METTFLKSILDNDFYKFTMQHAVIKLFPKARVRYAFINRGKHQFPAGFAELLRKSVDEMANLILTKDEKHYLSHYCPYLDPTYLDFLQGYRYDPSEVQIIQEGSEIKVTIEGFWYRTILWEVPLMALISELFYKTNLLIRLNDEAIKNVTKEKIDNYNALGVAILEFGTRRRHSYDVHVLVNETLHTYGGHSFIGTSNVHFAMVNNKRPLGTHAHEWFMFHAAQYGFKMANLISLDNWTQVYGGDLGIALTDTYTTNVFFEQFDKKYSKLFDGVRHDSGDPIAFAQKVITHYTKMGIDPRSKTIVFSDSLNYEKVKSIANFCQDKIKMSFGIGTNFTNDVGLPSMNMVIKLTEVKLDHAHWQGVVKLSDEKNKNTGTPEMIALAKGVLGIK
ncbi:nicotinate phosphoribosyltransferase [Flavobacterium sp. Fl-77]|uniref:Nicotinate phosphoribosyltransferase n=1 Tax=Flavobacterium flavipigmentatum TaxID=2893884 RepID=A0AAJ2VXK0_9FLAO|nr:MULTISPECIES: nicotinate phosphoribosyltransferase [unclassified Flavobacterium]MDX6181687.1 nicotinate phosphoribosyltransferase [Flavobacterium sp. Fl-33]MDX6185279.1 nicotinate phosphoribosyltransferase [Flavobacterium sp. Fl-77]UFH37385.1 nicotinate phosphoribosyltransferase [Flavobacterium sp. F-70]